MRKTLKYELKNILRSRWLAAYLAAVGLCAVLCIRAAGDDKKAVLAFYTIIGVMIPFSSAIFSAAYWYYSDRFTQIVLTLPVERHDLFWSRWVALFSSQTVCLLTGGALAFALFSHVSTDLAVALLLATFLSAVFITLGILVSLTVQDRMKGLALVMTVCFYFAILHDGLLLLALAFFRQQSLEYVATVFAALNPIGLARVVLLLKSDAPLLLGQTGAMMRHALISWQAYLCAGVIAALWIAVPLIISRHRFSRADL